MKLREKIITFIFCIMVIGLYFVIGKYDFSSKVRKIYNVYLDGNIIGSIDNRDKLYELIDEKQQIIKDKYNVNNVYPPSGLQVIESYSYDAKTDDLDEIYSKIEKMQDFTILGYEVKISKSDNHDEYKIYILDKNILKEALEEFILAFVDEEDYQNYISGNQGELEDIGVIYRDMGFLENISIREKYISINDKIYESSEELAQSLLFGFAYQERTYTVKEGDTIESISEENTLNTQEFLIANPEYNSKDSLLTIGDKVNITLINPQLSFSYVIYEMKEVEKDYEKIIERDNTKSPGYSEITQPGVKGLQIETSHYTVVNGETIGSVEFDGDPIIIRPKVDQITTKGRVESTWGWENFDDTGEGWRWPTENPYAITSEFSWRWGKHHNGLDISGAGWGSKIYAANAGIVVKVNTGCPENGFYGSNCGGEYGNYVIINHGNNIYTLYAHMLNSIPVREGQTVSRGTVVGYMGNSGSSQGTHLHFGYSIGEPNRGGTYRNPRELYR